MTPEELASYHPRLFHITEPNAWASIRKWGLLSTTALLNLFEVHGPERLIIETKRRPAPVELTHPEFGSVFLNDNVPLIESCLIKCLEDNLTVVDWMHILNKRVFFWPSEENLQKHLGARLNKGRKREILVLDTLSLAKEYADQIEICPINSGTAIRKAAKRGLNTFSPLTKYPYSQWRKLRGKNDKIQEVTVLYQVKDIESHLIDIYHT